MTDRNSSSALVDDEPRTYGIQDDDPMSHVEEYASGPHSGPSRRGSVNSRIAKADISTNSSAVNLNGSISVSNPITQPVDQRHRMSMFVDPDVDPGQFYQRVESLREMRPQKIIGHAHRLIDWSKYYTSELKLSAMKKPKGLREYYTEQNVLIDRYTDVDALLDSGVRQHMLQNYEDNAYDDAIAANLNGPASNGNNAQQIANAQQTAKQPIRNSSSGPNEYSVPGCIDAEGAKVLGGGDKESSSATVKWAIYVNFAINIMLLVAKCLVAFSSNSMSIMASLVDSVLDFMSTLIIFFSNKYAARRSSRFPVGRRRLEPIGVLVFSIVIIISFLQVLIESAERLTSPNHEIVSLTRSAISIMVTTIAAKFVCYIVCSRIHNSSVEALTEDAKTDVIFNTFSLIFPVIEKITNTWWVDAAGACMLCLYVIVQWGTVMFEHIDHLCGSNASKEDYQEILYLVGRFSDNINAVKNYRIYHQGDLLNVEVDIVIKDAELGLKDCHDLGESLQYAIETLPFVERCFVHLDYKVRNYVGHITK